MRVCIPLWYARAQRVLDAGLHGGQSGAPGRAQCRGSGCYRRGVRLERPCTRTPRRSRRPGTLVRGRAAGQRRTPDVRVSGSAAAGPGLGGGVRRLEYRTPTTSGQVRFIDAPLRQRSGVRRGRGQELSPVARRQGRELVGTVAANKGRIPAFRSDQEERAFWAHHSLEEFARDLGDLDVEIRPPRTEQIALRLHKEDLQVLRSLAAKRGVGHTTLARTVLEGWLARSRSKTRRTGRTKTRRPA